MNPVWKKIFGSLWLLFWILSSGPVEATTKCFVSISPQRYFVQKIGGPLVDVSVLVSPGADPHTYEPKPRQMAELAQSALYFALGIDFEKAWLRRIAGTNRQLRIVHTDAGIEKINMPAHNRAKNDRLQNERSRHPHAAAPDPHIWLSPPLVKQQAEQILRALVAVDPANEGQYKTNFAVFAVELEALDSELKALLAGIKGESFLVLHPSWGYFAHAYGLVQVPIEIEGKDPKPAQLQRLIGQAKAEAIKRVFVQPQFSAKNAETVAREIGGAVVYADPLAENWAENLRDVTRKFTARER